MFHIRYTIFARQGWPSAPLLFSPKSRGADSDPCMASEDTDILTFNKLTLIFESRKPSESCESYLQARSLVKKIIICHYNWQFI